MKLPAIGLLTLALFVTFVFVASAASQSTSLVPDFASERITVPVDVTDAQPSAMAPAAVGRDQALALARLQFDRPGASFRIYRAVSRRYASSADRDVWVVVFSGGTPFFGGPMGRTDQAPTATMTGIIIDVESGEFLRGFME